MANIDRIKHAIKIMERVRDNHKPFDMNEWFVDDPYSCNTPACFWGWCARDEEFRQQGVYASLGVHAIFYEDNCDADAVQQFFDIDGSEAEDLVMPSTYPGYSGYEEDGVNQVITPDQVIGRLVELLEKYTR